MGDDDGKATGSKSVCQALQLHQPSWMWPVGLGLLIPSTNICWVLSGPRHSVRPWGGKPGIKMASHLSSVTLEARRLQNDTFKVLGKNMMSSLYFNIQPNYRSVCGGNANVLDKQVLKMFTSNAHFFRKKGRICASKKKGKGIMDPRGWWRERTF